MAKMTEAERAALAEDTVLTFKATRGDRVALVMAAQASHAGNVSAFIRAAIYRAMGAPALEAALNRAKWRAMAHKMAAHPEMADDLAECERWIAEADRTIAEWRARLAPSPAMTDILEGLE